MHFPRANILFHDMEILHQQTADGHRHPAILIAMVVDGAGLADFPADGDQFIEGSFIDEVASVVLAVPGEIRSEGIGINRGHLAEIFAVAQVWSKADSGNLRSSATKL